MLEARGTRRTASRRQARTADALAGALVAVLLLSAGCGLKGALTLPEKPSNVVIRPGPGAQQPPAGTPAPAPEPLPPPELPPDTRGNTRG
jgi:predicted small lipoprotein YifL